MNLNNLTKADLVWIIERMKQYDISGFHYDRAMADFKLNKNMECLKEADRQAQIAHDERVAYCDILKPYDGKRLIDIPLDVIEKADAAMKRAQAADRKWAKLMEEVDRQ